METLSATDSRMLQMLLLLSLVTLPFKGLALWKAAQHKSRGWFVLLLIVNSLGILDIVYYYFVDAKKTDAKPKKQS